MIIHFVTGNTGKFAQVQEALWPTIALEQIDLDIPEIQTTSLELISADKARQAFEQVWKPVLVEDSWILFDAFHEFPWALTKFIYQWIGLEGMRRLYEGVENKKAIFECVLSYMDASTNEPIQFIGQAEGMLNFDYLDNRKEDPRLPYDLIFVADWMDKPVIYHMDDRKSQLSHRVKAVKKAREWMEAKT